MEFTEEQKKLLKEARLCGELLGRGQTIGYHLTHWSSEVETIFDQAAKAGDIPSGASLDRALKRLAEIRTLTDELVIEISAYERLTGR